MPTDKEGRRNVTQVGVPPPSLMPHDLPFLSCTAACRLAKSGISQSGVVMASERF